MAFASGKLEMVVSFAEAETAGIFIQVKLP
jgi:hypothetical protein